MSDKFEKAALITLKGIVPGAKIVAELSQLVFGGNDEAFQAALLSDIQDELLKLQDRVGLLEQRLEEDRRQPESDLGAIRTRRIARDYLEGLAEAQGDAKRSALANVTARQLDPRLGDVATRRYWMDYVRSLDDIAVHLLKLFPDGGIALKATKLIAFSSTDWHRITATDPDSWADAAPTYASVTPAEWHAYGDSLQHLVGQKLVDGHRFHSIHNPDWKEGTYFSLRDRGRLVKRVLFSMD